VLVSTPLIALWSEDRGCEVGTVDSLKQMSPVGLIDGTAGVSLSLSLRLGW